MLYLVAMIAGLGIGFLRGGRLRYLAQLKLRWLWLVPLALVIQLLIFPLFSGSPLLPYATEPLHLASYALLMLWLVMNVRTPPMSILSLGAICNFVVIVSNGGYMPASATALQQAGLAHIAERLLEGDVVANVTLMSALTRVNALGDWLYLPSWIPFSTALSIGDVLIAVGLVWLLVRGMVANE